MDQETPTTSKAKSSYSGELDSVRPQSYTPLPTTPTGSEGLDNPDIAGPAAKRRMFKKLLKASLLMLALGAVVVLGWYVWL